MSAYTWEAFKKFKDELSDLERSITNDLGETRKKSQEGVNTFNSENSARKGLEKYHSKVVGARDDYMRNAREIKNVIPEKEYNARVNEFQTLLNNYERMKATSEAFIDSIYKHVFLYYLY